MNDLPGSMVAIVREILPNAMFRVEISGGRSLSAHIAGDARGRLTRLVPGDAVQVETSPFDSGTCRIVGRAPGARGR